MSKVIHTVKTNHVALNKLHQKNTTAYRFADPDPIIDLLRTAIADALDRGMGLPEIAADAMCNYQTVARIFDGTTRRPMNTTCDRILKACGFTRPIIRAILDAHGKTLDLQEMYDAFDAIITKKMSHAAIIALARNVIGKN
jgi:hypothetical protein